MKGFGLFQEVKRNAKLIQGNFLVEVKIILLSGVGFEPTPTSVDCDLNAAP